jgi:hypothetical protein
MKTSSQESLLEEANTSYINALYYRLPRRTKKNARNVSLCHGLAVCRWDLNTEFRLRYQVSLDGIYGGQSDTETGFSPMTSVFSSLHH